MPSAPLRLAGAEGNGSPAAGGEGRAGRIRTRAHRGAGVGAQGSSRRAMRMEDWLRAHLGGGACPLPGGRRPRLWVSGESARCR